MRGKPETYDYSAPRYRLEVEGEEVRADLLRYVDRVEYEQSLDFSNVLELHVANPVSDATGVRLFTDSKVFLEGNAIDLWIGYGPDLEYMGRTYVGKWYPHFPEHGLPHLVIKAYDFRMKMSQKVRHTGYTYRKTDADLARHVASAHWGLPPDDVRTPPNDVVRLRTHKRGGNDLQFMNKLAALNNFEFFTYYDPVWGGERFYFGPSDDPDHPFARLLPHQIFEYGEQDVSDRHDPYRLYDFHPAWAVHGQRTKVLVSYYDRVAEKNVVVEVAALNRPPVQEYRGAAKYAPIRTELTSGVQVTLSAFGESQQVVADVPIASRADAKVFAERWFLSQVQNFLIGEGKVLGQPLLRPKQTHRFGNVGARFSGDYYLTRAKHLLEGTGAYYTEFSCRKRVLDKVSSTVTSEDAGSPDSMDTDGTAAGD